MEKEVEEFMNGGGERENECRRKWKSLLMKEEKKGLMNREGGEMGDEWRMRRKGL